MKTFFDSSAFAKRYIVEEGSEEVDEICQTTDRLAFCVICIPEILSALNRRIREKIVSRSDYATIKGRLLEDARDVEIINLTDEVVAHSMLILEQHPLRAMDALHIACAQAWKADLFVSADQDQVRAAKRLGLFHRLI